MEIYFILMKIPKFLKNNLLLKITSVNSSVIVIRLVITAFVQNILTRMLGETGIYTIGQLRNLIPILTSVSSVGFFNGIVKQVAVDKNEQESLSKLFSTVFVFVLFVTICLAALLFVFSERLSIAVLDNQDYAFIFKILAFIVPFIALNRIFNGVINGLSDYKKFSSISLVGYVFTVIFLLVGLYNYSLAGVLFAISIEPLIQLAILLFIFGSTLKKYLKLKSIKFQIPYAKQMLGFSLMSFTSTILVNVVEIDIRTSIKDIINKDDAAYWTGMVMISKNYMVFSSALFSLYVIPIFSNINTKHQFTEKLAYIYKIILPLFLLGMIFIYLFRDLIIKLLFPGFVEMRDLFEWQLIGDFIRLGALILTHFFIAKKMVKSFILTELLSVFLFYTLSHIFIYNYGVEGVVMAHALRYFIYFFVVLLILYLHFKKLKEVS